MKKNKMMRIASVLLVAVLLSTCAISGTFAKYTSSTTATSTATVAKWDVKLENKAFSDTITFNFAETWKDTRTSQDEVLNVTQNMLAPGTSGSFSLDVTNSSDVNAKFNMSFDFTSLAGIPLTFTYTVGGDAYTPGNFVAIGKGETKTVTVNWVWAFEGNDTTDTAAGEAAVTNSTLDVGATVIVEQVD